MLLDADLMVVGEHQAVGGQVDTAGLVAASAGHRVGREEPHVLDQIDAPHLLQQAEDLTGLDRPAEWPAVLAWPSSRQRTKEFVDRTERFFA
jgi:hypothetical protein